MNQESRRISISERKRRLQRETCLPIEDSALLPLEFYSPNGVDIVVLENLCPRNISHIRTSRNAQLLELIDPFVHASHQIYQAIGRRMTLLPCNKPKEALKYRRMETGIQYSILSFRPIRTITARCRIKNDLQAPDSDRGIQLCRQIKMIFLRLKPLTKPRSSVHPSK